MTLPSPLPPGTPAPDFSLESTAGRPLSRRDYRGQPLVLVFYPADGTSVCSSQLALYNEALELFQEHDAQLLGISVDDLTSHHTFSQKLNLAFPLLADNNPKGEMARAFGVYDERAGKCQRALFVIDGDGAIRWSHVSPSNVNPGADGILNALESLSVNGS